MVCAVAGKESNQRKQGWSHMCLPFHFENNDSVKSLIFFEMSGWLSHSGFSLVYSCWVNVLHICFVSWLYFLYSAFSVTCT